MTRFTIGDLVRIRYGKQAGLKGEVIKSLSVDSYEVRLEDSSVFFFSSKGLEGDHRDCARPIRHNC